MAELKRDALKTVLYLFHATPLFFSPQTAASGLPEERSIGDKGFYNLDMC